MENIEKMTEKNFINIYKDISLSIEETPIMELEGNRRFIRLHSSFKSSKDYMIAEVNQGFKIFKNDELVKSESNGHILDIKMINDYYYYYCRVFKSLFKVKWDGSEQAKMVKNFDTGDLVSSILHVDSQQNLILNGIKIEILDINDEKSFQILNKLTRGFRKLYTYGLNKLLVLESSQKLKLTLLQYTPYKKSFTLLKEYEGDSYMDQLFSHGLFLNVAAHSPLNLLVNSVSCIRTKSKTFNFFRISEKGAKIQFLSFYRVKKLFRYEILDYFFNDLGGNIVLVSMMMKANGVLEYTVCLSIFYDLGMRRVLKHAINEVSGVKKCTDFTWIEEEQAHYGIEQDYRKIRFGKI